MGLEEWYPSLVKPELSPPDWVFGPVWTTIYVLGALAAIMVWEHHDPFKMRSWAISGLFRLNLLFNVFWSYLFFVAHQILLAFVEMILLNMTTLMLILLIWPLARRAAILLLPYFVWVSFATYLTYEILVLNP
jgi:tryptophan-rich sensory protein